jgi:hypothetical protein
MAVTWGLGDAEGRPSRYRGAMMFPFPAAHISAWHDDLCRVLLPTKVQEFLRYHLSIVGYPIGQTMLVPLGEGRK